MANVLRLWLLVIFVLKNNIQIKCEPDWTYDVVSLDVVCKNPEKVDIELEVVRISRGVFAISGFVDIKEDITDQLFVDVTTYYSLYGSNFARSHYFLPQQPFSTYINTFYKDAIMESFVNCTENAPLVESVFRPPLTKRTMYMNNCQISNSDMPSKMRSGFYKVIFQLSNQAEGHIEIISKVEPKLIGSMILSIDVKCQTPDKVLIELDLVRIARGVYAVKGFVDIKEDLTDQLIVSLTTYYSLYGSTFARSPYFLPEQPLSTFINSYYKDALMESVLNCSENAPELDDVFLPPLTKRIIYTNNCKLSNDDMPSKLRSGYYKLIFKYANQAEGHVDIVIKVDPK